MIIELILTIFAWRKGWGPIALLPLAIGLPLGVLAAAVSNSLAPAFVADLLIYASLITMIVVGRKMNATVTAPQAAAAPLATEMTRQTAA